MKQARGIIERVRSVNDNYQHLELALEWIARARPERAVLTNMHVDLDHSAVEAETPAHVSAAYDGMVLEFAL